MTSGAGALRPSISRRSFIRTAGTAAGAATLGSCAALSRPAPRAGPLFSFVFCNDLHLSSGTDIRYLDELVDQWRALGAGVSFAAIGGDLVNNGLAAEFIRCRTALERLGKPWYLVAGNHDLTGEGPAGRRGLLTAFPAWKPNMLIQQKGIVFMFLDLTNGTEVDITVPESAIRWVRASASRLGAHVPLIVVSHFCVHPDVPRFPVKGADPLFDILDEKNLFAWFAGHYHGFWHGVRNNVDYYTNTCLSPVAENHDGTSKKGFLLVKVYPAGVRVTFVEKAARNT